MLRRTMVLAALAVGLAAITATAVGAGLAPGPTFGDYASPGGRYRLVFEAPATLERLWAPHGAPGHVSLFDAVSGRRLARSGLVAFEGNGFVRWDVECAGVLIVGNEVNFTGLQPEHVRDPGCPAPPRRPPPPGPVRVSTGL